jgi:hypothetical protein
MFYFSTIQIRNSHQECANSFSFELVFENLKKMWYIFIDIPPKKMNLIAISYHKFPTECGRWQNINLFKYMYSNSRLLCVFWRIVKAQKVDVAQCNCIDVIHFYWYSPKKNESNSYQFFNIVINKVPNFQYQIWNIILFISWI